MKARDKLCIIDDEKGRRELSIADENGNLCYHKVAALAKNRYVRFSNTTVEDLAEAYASASHQLKKLQREKEADQEKLKATTDFVEYAPALVEVLEVFFMNLPNISEDVALQTLEESQISFDKLKALIDAFIEKK